MNYSEEQWLEWIDQLAADDFVIIDRFLPADEFQRLLHFFTSKEKENSFAKAGIGLDAERVSEIRGDFTYWLERETDTEMAFWFNWMDELKKLLNRYCYLSLSGDEFHLAHYPKGSFYKKHLDQFQERNNRMITVLLYLNENWEEAHQGFLKIYKKDRTDQLIAPLANRLVIFKSADLPHEVLPTTFGRNSLTGWLLYEPRIF